MKRKITTLLAIAALLASLAVIGSGPRCFGDDIYPTFRKGMWQVDDTMEINGKPIKHPTKKCMGPTDEVRGKLAPGSAFGCVTAPPKRGEDGLYLTVTGLSAEHGDDGEVGRGNRVNGLITPCRPMSLEAAAGKNPVAHVGKIYNVLAMELAHAICANVGEVAQASVQIVSTIGKPIAQPQLVASSWLWGRDQRALRKSRSGSSDDSLC